MATTPDKKPPKQRKSVLWKSRRVFYALVVVGIVGFGGLWLVLNSIELPAAERSVETSFVCDINVAPGECGFDSSMAILRTSEERVLVNYEDLPAMVVEAVLATEDRTFFEHNGIDPLGIGRALYRDLAGDSESQQGGSTITQQYVKTEFLSSERTLERKIKEAVMAVKLEQELDKREILTRYLNEVYFGRGAYGIEAASRAYFGVGVQDLQLYQAAYLAGLIRSPETADAARDPEEATRRRNVSLNAMVDEGYITEEEAEEAKSIPWLTEQTNPDGTPAIVTVLPRPNRESDFGNVQHGDIGSEYWLELIRKQLRERFGEGAETRGLRVYTSFDPYLQRAAVEAVNSVLDEPDAPLGSLVSVDREGRVRAMVGGGDFGANQVNLALGTEGGGSGRPAGSTFKPFGLAAFVEQDYSVESRMQAPATTSFPGVYASPGELWTPGNYDGRSHGVQTIAEATWDSTNTVYAGIVDEITPESLVDVAGRLGIRSELNPNYSLILGAADVSVIDMTSAYSTFSRRGVRIDPYVITRVEDSLGNLLFDASAEVKREQAVSPEVADTVTDVLSGVIEKGTGTGAALGRPAAGKTGTTDDSADAWFAGYTCDFTAAVWMGYENPQKMVYKGRTVYGGNYPATIWQAFMEIATEGNEPCDFPETDAGSQTLNSNYRPSSQTTTTAAPVETTEPESSTTTEAPATTAPAATTTAAPSTTAAPPPTTPEPE